MTSAASQKHRDPARTSIWAPLDKSGQVPLYRQVKVQILDLIDNGTLARGAKIMSERELVSSLDVSRITVRQALTELVQEGHLLAQPGKGFYVSNRQEPFELHLLTSFTAHALSRELTPGSKLIGAKIFRAPAEITRPLLLPDGSDVVSLRRLRTLDGEPVVIQEDWLPPNLVPGILELDWSSGNRSLYTELRDRYGLRPQGGQTDLSARLPTEEENTLLKLEAHSAVLILDQIAYSREGTPINLSTSVQHSKRYPLSIRQGE